MPAALLTLHMQEGIVRTSGPEGRGAVDALRSAVVAARASGIPVIHVRMAFRPGLADVTGPGRTNPFFASFVDGAPDAELERSLGPEDGDLSVVSRRASAFKGSDLQTLLSSQSVTELVLGGIGTSGVVLATTIEAADLDLDVTVLEDGCADPDPVLHRLLLDKVVGLRASVTTTADWLSSLG